MSVLLADIDATCASLGYNDGVKYQAERDSQQGLKHLIWILRRDNENHEHRRHLGKSSVLRTDLVPMLYDCTENDEFTDVLIRLLVILTNPTLLLYRDGAPKDNQGRKFFMELIEILQRYKEAFTSLQFWIALKDRLHKVMEVDWALRSEEQGLLCERILVLIRNVLQVPGNPDAECRADNDASLHDQVIWSLHQSGIFDLVLYVIGSPDENQYHLHALEILCLMFREQSAESLADATLQRSTVEKNRDEQELIKARRREKEKLNARLPTMRHSRFGGTYVIQNFKSISDKDMIFHSPLQRAVALDLDFEKPKQKKSHRLINEEQPLERRSAFSVRLCLREYCLEVLKSAYNTLVRQVRRVLERNSGSTNHDDSYLLWAIRFFMEFNRLSGLQLQFVSESLSVQCFHWVLTRIQHDMDMMTSDKKQSRLWAKRMHVAVQTFRELLLSLIALQNLKDDKALALFNMLLNNVCYVLEYRETILHLLMNYNEAHSTRAFLRDIVETANIFIKMMEKFCKGSVVVQDKRRGAKRKGNKKSKKSTTTKNREEDNIHLEDKWIELASELSSLLSNEINLPEEDHPIPFDAASDKNIDDQKDDCMMRVYTLLRQDKLDQAVLLLRAAREVWPDNDCFGAFTAAPEDELLLLREIYLSDLGSVESTNKDTEGNDEETENNDHERDDDDDEDEEEEPNVVEKDLSFEDFAKRLVNPKIIRSCTLVLSDWEKIPTKSLKSAVTIMHRIAYSCSCPAMLYQAVLFRIFQQVLNTPRDSHHEELRRLGIYVIRKFIEMAPKNPKIYAELLFYKSIREANELEMGYCDAYETGTKGSWSEEQEDELRILFIENQNNPQSDQDVIDWILDNLIDKTRTRRGVLKKLKELGLLFKAPTKKSTAAANKNLWQTEEDEELKSLYDEHRAEDDCLQRIVNAFGERRSKNLIIKRLIQLHIIADKSEILPSKSRKGKPKKTSAKDGNNESDEENDENDNNGVGRSSGSQHKKPSSKQKKNKTKTKTRKIVKTPLDVATVRSLLEKLNEELQEAVEWLKESLNEAADDIVEDIEEDDGVPLLPLTAIQRDAMEDNAFQSVLIALGIQPPIVEMENYWRIPVYLTSTDLQLRAKVVAGEEVNVENNEDCNDDQEASDVEDSDSTNIDSDESEVDYLDAQINKRRENLNNLVFNKSDDEDEIRAPIKKLKKKRSLSGNSETDEDSSVSQKPNKTKSEKIKKPAGGNKFSMENMKLDASQNGEDVDTEDILNFDSENLRQRLAELSDSDGSDEENNVTITNRTRIRKNVIASDSSDDEIENIDTDMNAGGSSQSTPTKINGTLNSSTVIYNNDENSDAYTTTMTSKTSKKRARSDDNDNQDTVTITNVNNSSDEEELFIKRKKSTATNATDEDKPKRRRTAIIIDDDDDDADNDNDDDIQF